MKKTTTSILGLLIAMVAILVSSCSTNATFSKRYHSRGFNIAWGGGSDANNNPVKQTPKKVKAKSDVDVVAQNTDNFTVQSVKSTENTAMEASTVTTAVVSNNILAKNEVKTVKNANQTSTHAVKSSTVVSKKAKLTPVSSVSNKALSQEIDWVAFILCFFLGGLGIHRFYLGYPLIGVLQILTLGGFGIWILIDLIRIISGDLGPA
ncbi:MAG: TM2 domain-containing protein [Bacteroidetes bacterium]|nr:TM2 domain-containing protein [Bacteroidota bacterium]